MGGLELIGGAALGGLAGWQADRLSCRLCGTRPSRITQLAAAASGAAAWGYAAVHWPSPDRYAWMAWLWALGVLADVDLRERWLPDAVTMPLAASGLLYRAATGEAARSAYGLLAGGVLFGVIALGGWCIWRREALGGGDVKLAAALGAWQLWPEALWGWAAGCVIGGLYGTVVMLWRLHHGRWRWGAVEVPFGPFLIAGAVALAAWGPPR